MTWPIGSFVQTDFATPSNVSTLTVLLPWWKFDKTWRSALLALVNLSGTETVTMTVDVSEDASSPDSDKQQVVSVPPNSQGSVEFGDGMLRTWVRLSANTQGPSFNPASVKWLMKGRT